MRGPSPGCTIRPLEPEDEPFLWEMLYHAIYVPAGEAPPPRDIVRRPELARYVQGWGQVGDCGFIAVDKASGQACGAVWLRLLVGENRAYGYVDEQTPELAIALLPGHRGRGIGTALVDHLFRSECGDTAVCLGVSAGNPARRLYERLGFRVVEDDGEHATMKREKRLGPPSNIPGMVPSGEETAS